MGINDFGGAAERLNAPSLSAWAESVRDALVALTSRVDAIEAGGLLPAGGTAGQLLAKASGDDYDTEWIDPPESGGGGGTAPALISGVAASSLTSGSVGATVTCGEVAAGDIIVVISAMTSNTGSMVTPVASGLTFTEIRKTESGDPDIGAWWAVSPDATSRSITAASTPGSTAVNHIAVLVLRPADGTNPVDVADASTAAFSASSTPTVTAITPTATNNLVIAAMVGVNYGAYGSAPVVTEAGWTDAAKTLESGWGGLAVACKACTADEAPGTVAFSQPSAAAGVSVSFSIFAT